MQHISSHWQKMLEGFDGRPENLRGVAHLSKRNRNLFHWLFQRKYFALGKSYPSFRKFLAAGRRVAAKNGRAFDLHMLRQCLTLGLIESHVPLDNARIIVIGDGFAAMGSTIMEALPKCHLTFINIKPVLEMDFDYFAMAHPNKTATFMPSEEMDGLPAADLSIDIACMGEINPEVRDRYFAILKDRVALTYSCNRESKTFPDGTTTNFHDYPWSGSFLVDELSPWHEDFYSFRPPFWRKFDGPVRHRLVRW